MPLDPLPFDTALHSSTELAALVKSLKAIVAMEVDPAPPAASTPADNPFFNSLRTEQLRPHAPTLNPTPEATNLTLTDNGGVTNASTLSATLDLFNGTCTAESESLLAEAWEEDALGTLKIIWNSRSIPRGKGEKGAWTRGVAWLAQNHPQTLLNNLEWIVRPTDLIPVKTRKVRKEGDDKVEGDDDLDLCDEEEEEEEEVPREANPSTARSHGYWKDLLNLVVLSSLPSASTATGSELTIDGDYTLVPGLPIQHASPYELSRVATKNSSKTGSKRVGKRGRVIPQPVTNRPAPATPEEKKFAIAQRLQQLLSPSSPTFHRALHLTVARAFGAQLQSDVANLALSKELRVAGKNDEACIVEGRISLAAKWAPTEGAFHDRLTRIASSIAEFLTPLPESRTPSSLVRALSIYRATFLSPLRQHLEIVERRMSANEWDQIRYPRVPSIAMDKNKIHFYQHDAEGFLEYLSKVQGGKATISGAALTPANLVRQIQMTTGMEQKVMAAVVDAQWNALVQSVKDVGKLSTCIAVADVSGSMQYPTASDGTAPIHSSIALSILIAQVTEPPFHNSIITFSEEPSFIDLTGSTLSDHLSRINDGMGYNTNLIAVFRLILGRAVALHLAPEQIVKQIFVFSDMEFDAAEAGASDAYATHFDIIQSEFNAAGYDLPEIVFWNLTARRGRRAAPVTKQTKGACLVSGYSAAMVKVFLDGGGLGAEEKAEEEIEEVVETEGGELETVTVKVKKVMDPLAIMRKAIGHESFDALKVHD
jgi:hypothetical protein